MSHFFSTEVIIDSDESQNAWQTGQYDTDNMARETDVDEL